MSFGKFVIYYGAILIALLIVVAYYRGSTSVLGTFGSFLDNTVLFLQGRNKQGTFAAYPAG